MVRIGNRLNFILAVTTIYSQRTLSLHDFRLACCTYSKLNFGWVEHVWNNGRLELNHSAFSPIEEFLLTRIKHIEVHIDYCCENKRKLPNLSKHWWNMIKKKANPFLFLAPWTFPHLTVWSQPKRCVWSYAAQWFAFSFSRKAW
jgi:hypothetical protein